MWKKEMICMIVLDEAGARAILPKRDPWGHKGTFGKVLLLCGSEGYTGAAALSAMAALRSGAGLVFLGVPRSIYAIEAIKLTEPVVFPLPDENGKLSATAIPHIMERLSDMDAVLVGPGLGRSEDVSAVVTAILKNAKCPVILDADGINCMAAHMDVLRDRTAPLILTPHDGEFSRLGGNIGADRASAAASFAKDLGCIVLLKGHRTVITDGDTVYENHTGNSGMAVGGSGDVLAGMITAFVGQKVDPLRSAAAAAWFHGRAGDVCAGELGEYGMLPSDMLNVLPRLLK